MSEMLLNLKHSYAIVPIVVVFAMLLTFIDSKITGKESEMSSYLKIAIGSALISFFIVYVNTLHGVVNEEILTGAPPF
jgi:hypothetical protein